MATLENSYWWHRGKLSLLKSLNELYFPNPEKKLRILEIGSGTGEVSNFLSQYGNVTSLDISEEAQVLSREKGITNFILGDINTLDTSIFTEKFDLILALDVLEHIDDDVKTMQVAKELLADDGLFFINVPAHKFLWSEHDEALCHRRRYHSLEISKKLTDSGYEILKKSYFVTFAFPIIAAFRIWNNIFGQTTYPKTSYVILPDLLNKFMIKVLDFEAFVLKNADLFIGTTLVVVAQPAKE